MSTETASLEALLAATASGDRAAFEVLYRTTSAHLFGLLLRILREREMAEEALQDCYVRVWEKASSFDATRGAAGAWLAGIARNRALDLLRKRRPISSGEDAEAQPDPQAEVADLVDDDEIRAALHQCLRELGVEQREALMLAFFRGYSHGELAERIQQPLGTVKSRVRRGLLRLRECLER